MTQHRLFAPNSTNGTAPYEQEDICAQAFCKVIQGYIDDRLDNQRVNPQTSAGIMRAQALIRHIKNDLVQKRNFTGQQLLWIMFDYATRERGCWPLDTSNVLRRSILNYLCSYFSISDQDIEQCMVLHETDRLNMDALKATPPGFFNPDNVNEPFDYATEFMIKLNLVKKTNHDDGDNHFGYSQHLLTSLNKYIVWAEKKWFRGNGIARAKNIKTLITTEWLPYENLNETQLMWRLLEQIELPRESKYGIFGSSTDCRLMVMRDLCDYLGITAAVNQRMQKAVNQHYTERVGFTYLDRTEDDFQKEVRVSTQAIRIALQNQSPQNTIHKRM